MLWKNDRPLKIPNWDLYYLYGRRENEGGVEVPESSYAPTGDEIHLDAFCRPLCTADILAYLTCTICTIAAYTVDPDDGLFVTA